MTEYDLDKLKKDIKRLYNLNLIDATYYGDISALVAELINKSYVIFKLLETIDLDKLELDEADK